MSSAPTLMLALACADAGTSAIAPTASAAFAVSASTCSNELATVRAAIGAAEFTSDKDLRGALAKLDAAQVKLAQNKAADAVAKLTNVRTSAESLIAAGKLADDAESSIVGALDEAIACIEAANAG
jgi:hypothetical protein